MDCNCTSVRPPASRLDAEADPLNSGKPNRSRRKPNVHSFSIHTVNLTLTYPICRIKNKHGLRPIDLLPPPPPPSRNGTTTSDAELEGTEAVRAALRRAEAEFAMTSGGPGNDDIASGESGSVLNASREEADEFG